MIWQIPFIVTVVLVAMGLYICLTNRNIIKIIMGISLMEAGANLFLVALGYRDGGVAPIWTQAMDEHMVMPTTQALTLTAIVIGLATTALMLGFAVMIHRRYGTLDVTEIRRLRG